MNKLQAMLIDSLTALATAREYAVSHPESTPPPRADGCPECGAFPDIIPGTRQYRARVPGGARCTETWHEAPATKELMNNNGVLALDPQPWQHGYRGNGSEDRYSFTQGSKSPSFYMRWNPRPEYEQDMKKYGASA